MIGRVVAGGADPVPGLAVLMASGPDSISGSAGLPLSLSDFFCFFLFLLVFQLLGNVKHRIAFRLLLPSGSGEPWNSSVKLEPSS